MTTYKTHVLKQIGPGGGTSCTNNSKTRAANPLPMSNAKNTIKLHEQQETIRVYVINAALYSQQVWKSNAQASRILQEGQILFRSFGDYDLSFGEVV
jgi:hypothetical protein